jgi:hypothetical protein
MVLQHDDMIDVRRHDKPAATLAVRDPSGNLGQGLIHPQSIDFHA